MDLATRLQLVQINHHFGTWVNRKAPRLIVEYHSYNLSG